MSLFLNKRLNEKMKKYQNGKFIGKYYMSTF